MVMIIKRGGEDGVAWEGHDAGLAAVCAGGEWITCDDGYIEDVM